MKIPAYFSPEQQLLVAATHSGTGNAVASLLCRDLDWSYILNTANEHGVIPLLHSNLKNSDSAGIPADKLKTIYSHNLRKNMALTHELLRLTGTLEAQGIRAVPFKGPVLAQQLYNDIGLRQSADIDLLILKEDYHKVKDILLKQGYTPEFDLSKRQEVEFLRHQCEMPFLHKERGMNIEIHWDLAPRIFHFGLYRDGLWERLQPATFAGKTIQSFSAEDMLMYLCFHGSKHGWERLSWIYDILRILETRPLDWHYILHTSDELGSKRTLLLGLCLADHLWKADIPSAARKEIEADPCVSSLALYMLEGLFSGNKKRVYASGIMKHHLRLTKKARHKLRLIGHTLFVPSLREWQSVSIPDQLYFLYYFVRIFRMLEKAGN